MQVADWRAFRSFVDAHGDVRDARREARWSADRWSPVRVVVEAYQGMLERRHAELEPLLQRWDEALAALGGDPTHVDWDRFRPLRLEREEDWSDWLAFLFERSETGAFAGALFGEPRASWDGLARPRIEREVTAGGYRADLIIRWTDGRFAHVEVKTGDPSLGKTGATGRAMRQRYGSPPSNWSDWILLLAWQQSDWDARGHREIGSLTWDAVAVALRQGLRSREPVTWQAWAWAFVGAIEQILIGYPGHCAQERPLQGLEQKVAILKEALADED